MKKIEEKKQNEKTHAIHHARSLLPHIYLFIIEISKLNGVCDVFDGIQL